MVETLHTNSHCRFVALRSPMEGRTSGNALVVPVTVGAFSAANGTVGRWSATSDATVGTPIALNLGGQTIYDIEYTTLLPDVGTTAVPLYLILAGPPGYDPVERSALHGRYSLWTWKGPGQSEAPRVRVRDLWPYVRQPSSVAVMTVGSDGGGRSVRLFFGENPAINGRFVHMGHAPRFAAFHPEQQDRSLIHWPSTILAP